MVAATRLMHGHSFTYLIVASIGCVAWQLAARRRGNVEIPGFLIRNLVRYYVASVAFSYGLIKILALQMPFPNLSQLATPLGDFLPMRLSWMFIGYSTPYQVFSGVMETVFRRETGRKLIMSN